MSVTDTPKSERPDRKILNLQPTFNAKILCLAVTEVWHDSMNEIKATNCEPAGCYSRTPSYRIPMDQIISVISHSQQCKQFIKVGFCETTMERLII